MGGGGEDTDIITNGLYSNGIYIFYMSEDKQSCFEQALNSDEREATDRRLVAVAVWVLYQSSLLQRVTGPFCFWSHGSPTHVQNDQ